MAAIPGPSRASLITAALGVLLGAACKKVPPLDGAGAPVLAVGRPAASRLLVASGDTTCTLRKDGPWCWGGLGDKYANPRRLLVDGVTAIALGGSHYCVLKSDRTVDCAGRDLDGELGDGKYVNRKELLPVPGLSDVVQLAAAPFTTCAIVEPRPHVRQIVCFGADAGRATRGIAQPNATPTRVGDIDDAQELAMDWGLACARRAEGSVWCWGSDERGQLGGGTRGFWTLKGQARSTDPVRVLHVSDAVGISAGGFGACVVTGRATAGCWGNNSHGALGDGSTTTRSDPSNVAGLTDVAEIARGGLGHTCARRRDGTVWCWGYQIGITDDSTAPQTLPVRVASIDDAVEIASGHTHTCARRKNGSVACWGNNESGQLGNGTRTPATTPRETLPAE